GGSGRLLFPTWRELLAVLIWGGGAGRNSFPPASAKWSFLRDKGVAGEPGGTGGSTAAIAGAGCAGISLSCGPATPAEDVGRALGITGGPLAANANEGCAGTGSPG